MTKMWLTLSILVLILCNERVFPDTTPQLIESNGSGLSNEGFGHLNETYFNLNDKMLQLQRRIDTMEELTGVDDQGDCNQSEFTRSTSNELKDLSKTLSGFENEIRLLGNEQEEFDRILDAFGNIAVLACDEGWIRSPEGEICYFVSAYREKTDWATAIERCALKGARLVELRTNSQAQFLMQNLPNRVFPNDIIYTGRKRNDDDIWVFLSDGFPVLLTDRMWGSGEPDGGYQTCGCTKKTADFRMLDCFCTDTAMLYYICEKEPSIEINIPTPIPRPRDCEDRWTSSRDKCYYYSTWFEKTTWRIARVRCDAMGATLVEMKTDEEALFVMDNLPSRIGATEFIYTGRHIDDGEWLFSTSGERVDTAKRSWANGQPNGGGIKKCGCTRSTDNFGMRDCYCTDLIGYYICEQIRTLNTRL
ncbi:macrophage mannose receptor 1-like [Argopecten irradians]|uniref:macrophage mannose receptor 1-like n=1 Tax=Argopecten irradians TaxID=31199 RepID=UPI003710A4B5